LSREITGKTNVGVGEGVREGIAVFISETSVNATEIAVSITFDGFVVGVDEKLLQDASIATIRKSGVIDLTMDFTFPLLLKFLSQTPNGWRKRRWVDREPVLPEFYTRVESAKNAPESPPSAARRVGPLLAT
jgi:hypothetical protein